MHDQPSEEALERLQRAIEYRFADLSRLELALTHPSADGAHEPGRNNERMEFLGDAVLGLAAAQRLFTSDPSAGEGRLTKLKARLVSAAALEPAARRIGLGECLRLGPAEERSGGRDKKGLLVDALEALIAAVYLDGGIEAAESVAANLLLDDESIERAASDLAASNPKSALQELLQGRGEPLPEYQVIEESGPPHRRTFLVEVRLANGVSERANGAPKRAAEQEAARLALARLRAGEGNATRGARVE